METEGERVRERRKEREREKGGERERERKEDIERDREDLNVSILDARSLAQGGLQCPLQAVRPYMGVDVR